MRLLAEAFYYLTDFPSFFYGLWRISRMPQHKVTIFGGKFAKTDSDFYQQAFLAGQSLVNHGMAVMTGGGPGIMEAALCGAYQAYPDRALGIGVRNIDINFFSSCPVKSVMINNFDLRKSLLINYSIGFIVFPGGLGTLDEIAEVLNEIKIKRKPPVPIILIGKSFWHPLMEWIVQSVKEGYILKSYEHLFEVTDDIHYAVRIMVDRAKTATD